MSFGEHGVRSSWIWILAIFTLASFVDAGFYGQINAFTPLHLTAMGLPPDQVTSYTGLLAALTWAVGIPFLPVWGALADRYARQPVIARSFLAFLVAGLFMLVARDVWLFGVGRAIMSLALGNSGLMMTTLSECVPQKRMGVAFAIMNSAAPIGYFTAPLIGGPVVDRWGFSALLLISMGLVLVVTLLVAFGYHDPYKGTTAEPLWRMVRDSVTILVRTPSILKLFGAMFVLFVGWQAVIPYIPLITTSIYHGPNPAAVVGEVVGIGGLLVIIVGPATGALADHFGRWRVLFVAAGVSAVFLPLPLLAHSLVGIALAWSAANGVMSGVLALSFTVLSDTVTDEIRGRVMSFSWLPLNLSATAGPLVGSIVADHSVWWLFPVASMLTIAGIVVFALVFLQVRRPAIKSAAVQA